jgi:hypothetical protein
MKNSPLLKSGGRRYTPHMDCDLLYTIVTFHGVRYHAAIAMLRVSTTTCRYALEARRRRLKREHQLQIWSIEHGNEELVSTMVALSSLLMIMEVFRMTGVLQFVSD